MRITAGKLLTGSISVYALVSLCACWFRDSTTGASAVPFGEAGGTVGASLPCSLLPAPFPAPCSAGAREGRSGSGVAPESFGRVSGESWSAHGGIREGLGWLTRWCSVHEGMCI